MDGRYRYTLFQRVLHWSIALMVIAMIPLGVFATDFDNKTMIETALGQGSFNMLYDLHKSVGVTILGLMILRIVTVLVVPKPPYYPPLTGFQRGASSAVHGVLYVLLLATPLLGWIGVSAYPAPVPFFDLFMMPAITGKDREFSEAVLGAHAVAGIVLAVFVLMHIGAALFHGLIKRDGVLSRMIN